MLVDEEGKEIGRSSGYKVADLQQLQAIDTKKVFQNIVFPYFLERMSI